MPGEVSWPPPVGSPAACRGVVLRTTQGSCRLGGAAGLLAVSGCPVVSEIGLRSGV